MVCTGSGKSERDRLRFGKRSGFGMSLVSRGHLRGVGMFWRGRGGENEAG